MREACQIGRRFSRAIWFIAVCLTAASTAFAQSPSGPNSGRPAELEASDPEIRQLLDQARTTCGELTLDERLERIRKAAMIGEDRSLTGDRALAEAMLASAYIGRGELDLAFTTFQKALQDASDAQNQVLESDILISLAAQPQLKGSTAEAIELISKALSISEKSGSYYERARALGELGRAKLYLGKIDEAAESIDEALRIDRLNGFSLEALHSVYRGYYLGLKGKVGDAVELLAQAKKRAISTNDPYAFLSAENAYTFGLVKQGKAEEAIGELSLLKDGDVQRFGGGPKEQACLNSAVELPLFHLLLLEGLSNVLAAANQVEKGLDVWKEAYLYCEKLKILVGEAEAAQKIADLSKELHKTEDALEYYSLAEDRLRTLGNENTLMQVEVSHSLLLLQLGRGKESVRFGQEVASYAQRHNLRKLEFPAYVVLAEVYQPEGDLERARSTLEKALSLVQPGPFDSEIDNHLVLEAYSRLSDVYRGLKIPTKELIATECAFAVARHLDDQKEKDRILRYLDQRLGELKARENAVDAEKNGRLAESLTYSVIVLARDGAPKKPDDDSSNWKRVLTIPARMAQSAEGAAALAEILKEAEPLIAVEKIAMLDALAHYYVATTGDPNLIEKYALQSAALAKSLGLDSAPFRVASSCNLSIAYLREFKTVLAKQKITECLQLADETKDNPTIIFAQAANVQVQFQLQDFAAARKSLDRIVALMPDNPELNVELAVTLAGSGLYGEAAAQLDAAVAHLSSTGNKKATASAYVRVAGALGADQSPKGHELQFKYLTSAQNIYHDMGERAQECRVLVALGNYYIMIRQIDTGFQDLEKAMHLAQESGDKEAAAYALWDTGNAYQAQGEFSKAREFHRRAADAYHQLKNIGLETLSLQNLGRDYLSLGDTDESLAALLEAKKIGAEAPALTQYFVLLALGELYRQEGDFERALATAEEAVELTTKAGDLEHCAYSHLSIGALDGTLGSWDEARSETQTALELFQRIGNREGEADSWAQLMEIYSARESSLKDFDKALEFYEKAKSLGYGDRLQFDLQEIYIQTGKYEEAVRAANEGMTACLKDRDDDCRAHGLLSLSEAMRLGGDVKAARAALDQARPLALKSQDLYLHGRLMYGEAHQLVAEHKLDKGLAEYRKLIALIEGVKGRLSPKAQKSASETYGYIYDELVALLYRMTEAGGRAEPNLASEALEYAESNKARQFAESWGRTFIERMRRSLPTGIRETERTLFSSRDAMRVRLSVAASTSEPLDKNQRQQLENQLADTERKIADFLTGLRQSAPQYAAVAYPEAIQISQLPLRKGETLVEFKVTDEATFVWMIQNRSGAANELVSFYKVPRTRAWLTDRVSRLRDALNSAQPDQIDWKLAEEVFAALFPADAATLLSRCEEIIFIPDDILFAVPIEVYSPGASRQDFVFLNTATTYYPSAAAFRLSRTARHPSQWQEAFLGLADPITSNEDVRFVAAPVVSRGALSEKNQGATKDSAISPEDPGILKTRGFLFQRLPGTAAEVRSVAALLQQRNEKVEVRVGADATKTELTDTDLSKFRFLHFATHGILPVDTNVREPALVLSYDGVALSHMFLSMSEILSWRIQSESVVLSACNTGSGRISRAEGVMSLGRAFLAAGASSVTVSLWQVSDTSTALLMEQYYRGLLDGKKKSVALAEARNFVFSRGQKSPFFWAPFIVIGE